MIKGSLQKIVIFVFTSIIIAQCVPQDQADTLAVEAQSGVQSPIVLQDASPPLAPPEVTFSAPADGKEVPWPISIAATVSSASKTSWEMSFHIIGDPTNTVFASGDNSSTEEVSVIFDPTSLAGGIYEIYLSATDMYGQSSEASVEVLVTKGMDFVLLFRPRVGPVGGRYFYQLTPTTA